MTLKYNQGHWMWYEWVKLNEYYHHAKFGIIIISVRENCSIKVFTIYRPKTDHYIDSYFSRESKMVESVIRNRLKMCSLKISLVWFQPASLALSGKKMKGMLNPIEVKKLEMANMRKTGFFNREKSIISRNASWNSAGTVMPQNLLLSLFWSSTACTKNCF